MKFNDIFLNCSHDPDMSGHAEKICANPSHNTTNHCSQHTMVSKSDDTFKEKSFQFYCYYSTTLLKTRKIYLLLITNDIYK